MAFFGLTQLGEQCVFAAHARGADNLLLFSEKDFNNAFDRAVRKGKKNQIDTEQLENYFKELYGGPLFPVEEAEKAKQYFNSSTGLDKKTFVSKLIEDRNILMDFAQAQEEIEGRTKVAAEFKSNDRFRECARKGEKLKYGPFEKYSKPVLSSQRVGWDQHESKFGAMNKKAAKRYPKVASEETRFADAMVQYGIY